MKTDEKKTKSPPPKSETAAETKSAVKKKEADSTKDKSTAGAGDAAEKTVDPSSNYSRGEGQKPVSRAYKDNWNAIYAKKKKKR